MKKYYKLFALVFLTFICLLTLASCNGEDDYQFSDGTLIYRKVEGGYEVIGVEDDAPHDIDIPTFVNWESVVSIGSYAFNNNADIYTIKMPSTVKIIKDYAIGNCCNLLTVSIPDGIERVGETNFFDCPNLEYKNYENGKYVGNSSNPYLVLYEAVDRNIIYCEVNSRCKIIGTAFKFCKELENVKIPNGVKVIDKYAFFACGSLKELVIPSSVKIIGDSAFSNCSALERIEMSDKIEEIGESAFYLCRSLASISLPDTLKKINGSLFADCSKLEYNEYEGGLYLGNEKNPYLFLACFEDPTNFKATIHKDTKLIDLYCSFVSYGFDVDLNISEIFVPKDSKYFKSIDGNLYSKDGKTLVKYAPAKADEAFSVPEGVERIGEYAFCDSSVRSVYLPDSVNELGDLVFAWSMELENIRFSPNIKEIPMYAFSGCSSLAAIELPDGLKSIGKSSFSNCTSLESIAFPESLKLIYENAFYGCDALVSITISDNINLIDSSVFSQCERLENVVIGEGTKTINSYMFKGCTSLKAVTLNNSITAIERGALIGCESLEKIMFNGTVEEWLAIKKYTDSYYEYNWNYKTGNYTVICTDGKLDKNDNVIE